MVIHVSIHDVSPRWEREVDAALAMCHEHGIRPALLVVPNFHREAPLDSAPRYAARLRALQSEGHEIYLHGMFHQAGTTPRDAGWRTRALGYVAQNIASDHEAEFAGLPDAEAMARLSWGETVLHDSGLRIDGFVPPAWSMPRSMLAVLASRGYRFTEDHLRVYDPVAGCDRACMVLNYASRSPRKIAETVAYCRAAQLLHSLISPRFPVRIAIHPGDMNVLLLRRELARLLVWARGSLAACGADLLTA